MSKRLQVAMALLLGLLAARTRANPLEFKPDPESVKLGVAKYLVERTSGSTLTIQALDGQGSDVQTISATLDTPEGVFLDVKAGDEDLTLTVNFDTGRLSLKDNVTGESAAATPGQPLLNEGADTLLSAHAQTVSLAVVALEENLTKLGIPRSSPGRRLPQSGGALCRAQSPNTASPKDSLGNCSGVIITEAAFGSTQAIACLNATQDANNACTNGFCYGCCQLLLPPDSKSPCTCTCIPGSKYWCSCTVDGQACGSTWESNPGGGGSTGGGGGEGGPDCRLESGACSAACFSCPPAD